MRKLDVYLHRQLVGQLLQTDGGEMRFHYAPEWLQRPDAVPLSASLPLKGGDFGRNACRPFFTGVLPDESKRELIAKHLGISPRNDFRMLEAIGGECAGAISFITTGTHLPEEDRRYRKVDEEILVNLLEQLPRRPLLAGEKGIRLSLAGAQDKLAVFVEGKHIHLPLDQAPSSHILKPQMPLFEGLVYNEYFCMKLASAIGLNVADVEIRQAGSIPYLLVTRYDRIQVGLQSDRRLNRIHQEDFCQALGIVPEMKYEIEGGPSFKTSVELIRSISSVPAADLLAFLDAVLFNYLIGNHDAHGKNFSFLHGSQVRLAPLYDLVCTACYPELTNQMAMKVDGQSQADLISAKRFEASASDSGFSGILVKKRIQEITAKVSREADQLQVNHPIIESMRAVIQTRCTSIREDCEQ